MLDAIIVIAIVVLLIVGFWWTRGAGGIPGATDDPARQELRRLTEQGDPMPPPDMGGPKIGSTRSNGGRALPLGHDAALIAVALVL